MAEVTLPHAIEFPDASRLTLSEVAATLVATERIAKSLPEVLEGALPGLIVQSIRIELASAEISSLKEDFLVALVLEFQKEIRGEVMDLIQVVTGIDVPDEYDAMVTMLFVLVFLFALLAIYKRVFPGQPAAHLEGDYNTYLNLSAKTIDVTPEALEGVLQKAFKGRKGTSLEKASMNLAKPAKKGGNGRILFRKTPGIAVETVAQIPSEVDLEAEVEEEPMQPFQDVTIRIRATDLDKHKQGWWGIPDGIEGVTERLPLTLYPSINPESVGLRSTIRADIILQSELQESGDYRPVRIHVVRIVDDQSANL